MPDFVLKTGILVLFLVIRFETAILSVNFYVSNHSKLHYYSKYLSLSPLYLH